MSFNGSQDRLSYPTISPAPYRSFSEVFSLPCKCRTFSPRRKAPRAVARTLIGGYILIYSGSARLTSFEINFVSKVTSRAQLEYMNIHPPINALATALKVPPRKTSRRSARLRGASPPLSTLVTLKISSVKLASYPLPNTLLYLLTLTVSPTLNFGRGRSPRAEP